MQVIGSALHHGMQVIGSALHHGMQVIGSALHHGMQVIGSALHHDSPRRGGGLLAQSLHLIVCCINNLVLGQSNVTWVACPAQSRTWLSSNHI